MHPGADVLCWRGRTMLEQVLEIHVTGVKNRCRGPLM